MTATLTVSQSLAPIHRSVSVSWTPEAAFKRFTTDIATWWPRKTHSVPEGSGTRLELTADKWENWGCNARRARRGYEIWPNRAPIPM